MRSRAAHLWTRCALPSSRRAGLLTECALQVANVLLRLGEQRAQGLGDVDQTEVGRLLHTGPVALELIGLEGEVGGKRALRSRWSPERRARSWPAYRRGS